MFGRIRASASSLDTLEGSPSKLLKDDSFSIYEATLMKLKLGAQRDTSSTQMEEEEVINDCSVSSPQTEEAKMDADCTPAATASNSHGGDEITLMDTDCSSITTSHTSFSDGVSTENSEQPRHSNVSILHFFKIKDPGPVAVSSSGEPTSTKNGRSGSVSSSSSGSVESTCETESAPTFRDCELSERR